MVIGTILESFIMHNNPILVEITRGSAVESVHRGTIIICNARGDIIFSAGDEKRDIFPRSAVKIFQALPSVMAGAPQKYGFDSPAMALMVASHNGEQVHTHKAWEMLTQMGLTENHLQCGAHNPYDAESLWEMGRDKATKSNLHNNCSGKHCGMLALTKLKGWDLAHYHHIDHPLQLAIKNTMQDLCETTCPVHGVDGCSVPTWQINMRSLAMGFAKIAVRKDSSQSMNDAMTLITESAMQNPYFVAGKNRHCTKIMSEFPMQAFVKVGAEGVYCAALPQLGLGIVCKCDDGNERAANMMLNIALVKAGLIGADKQANYLTTPMHNWNGIHVGGIRAVAV